MGAVIPAGKLLKRESYGILRNLVHTAKDTFIWVNHSSLFAGTAGFLGGLEEAWIATITNPALVEAVIEYHAYQQLEYLEAAATAGGQGIWHCFMNEGANILQPVAWRKLVKPYIAKLIEKSHSLGLKHVAWFLDDCRPLVGDLIDIGIDGIATEQPRGDRTALLKTLRRQFHDAGNGNPFVVSTPGLTQEYEPAVVDFIIEAALEL